MATLTIHSIDLDGLDPDAQMAAASVGGDKAICGQGAFIKVTNGDGTSTNVTIATPETVDGDLAVAERVVAVPAGATRDIALTKTYRDPGDGLAHITYSKVTDLSIGSFRSNLA